MELTRLKELISTLPQEETYLDESENIDQIDVIRKLVDESIEALEAEIGEGGTLDQLMKKTGAAKLDVAKDKDGQTIRSRLFVRMKQFKKEVQQLIDEADLMISSGEGKSVEEVKESLLEGKTEYENSADFTEDFFEKIVPKTNEVYAMVKAPKFMKWMEVTDERFGTDCATKAQNVIRATSALRVQLTDLEDELDQAS